VDPQSAECPERGETLAERLERGPLPLATAVRYAYDIAKALREIHKKGEAHGSVSGRAIRLQPSGPVVLLPAGGLLPEDAWRADIRALGWVLQSLFPDEPPPGPPGSSAPFSPAPEAPQPGTSSLGVWKAARRLTAHCLADPPESDWSMQKVVSELRLLDLVARQWEQKARSQTVLENPIPKIWGGESKPERTAAVLPLAPQPAPPAAPAVTTPAAMQFAPVQPEPELSEIRCPRCNAPHVHPSTPRTDFEETLEMWNRPVLRCHRCSFRYFKLFGMAIRKEE
jgi:hypothetical protein